MALARQLIPDIRTRPVSLNRHRLLLFLAAVIATLFGSLAFVGLVMRDHGHPNVMVNEQSAPALVARSTPAAGIGDTGKAVAATKPAAVAIATIPNSGTRFNIARSSRRVSLGPLKLRLTDTDPVKNTYDVSVLTGRRSSSHRNIKVNEPLWIALNRGTGAIELVVTSIDAKQVSGYWTESNHSPQVSSRVRGHRR